MKFNWKVAAAAVVIIGVLFWSITSLRSNSYSGSNLNFGVGSGVVTISNPSDTAIPVQLVGTGSRSFSVSSNIDGVSGNSTRAGSGAAVTQTFLFDIPAGSSEFTVDRGTNVQFSAVTPTLLEASVTPLSGSAAQTTLVVSVIGILIALYFASSAVEHQWINTLRGKPAFVPATVAADDGHGRATRSYGDNRADQ